MGCKGICERIGTNTGGKKALYNKGYRYCCRCVIFFQTDKVYCDCCGNKMRSRPADRHASRKYRVRTSQSKYDKTYYESNKDISNTRKRQYNREHPEIMRKASMKYYYKNRERKNKERMIRYYNNVEHERLRRRIYYSNHERKAK